MPLVSTDPELTSLPALKLVGTVSFMNFFGDESSVRFFGETWERYHAELGRIQRRINPDRCFGLQLYPKNFPDDSRWYYGAVTEVETLDHPQESDFVSKYLPEAEYYKFTVRGPVTEIGLAFRKIYEEWLPKSGAKIAGTYDLECYDHRFTAPDSPDSETDILIPRAE